MNKGIIVVLVLLLLVGAVIAGILITRKSKYTKDTNVLVGAPLVANNCQTNCTAPGCSNSECCPPDDTCTVGTQDPPEGSTLNTICDDNHKCTTDQVCIPGGDGQNRCYFAPINKGGPPGKGCICWGRGHCNQNNTGCDCDANSNLADGQQRCQVCKDTYTWDGTKCVPPPNPCKNGGTPGPNDKCTCPIGFKGDHCENVKKPPTPTPTSATAGNGSVGCDVLLVCPYGDGTSLELNTSAWGNGGCEHDDQAKYTTKRADGCYAIGTIGGGPHCQFLVTSKTGTEDIAVKQDQCGLSAGDVTYSGSNITILKGDMTFSDTKSGQVVVGPYDAP